MKRKSQSPKSEARQRLGAITTALSVALILRAAGIEADGNDTAGKVEKAVQKLLNNGEKP